MRTSQDPNVVTCISLDRILFVIDTRYLLHAPGYRYDYPWNILALADFQIRNIPPLSPSDSQQHCQGDLSLLSELTLHIIMYIYVLLILISLLLYRVV